MGVQTDAQANLSSYRFEIENAVLDAKFQHDLIAEIYNKSYLLLIYVAAHPSHGRSHADVTLIRAKFHNRSLWLNECH